ncbi:unnamed protein product [Fusarium venenatum]|uniref:Uncharacterized protein n=1 Tax=Fusarium venenatum TaxID=56646 RepID=A0A2L2TIL6_9HYPO|nr:uncharacterized protein FVRRES_12858 [Fusarium venenatum]CEI40167.1 unnamed protein product [Fusarium venenatum]
MKTLQGVGSHAQIQQQCKTQQQQASSGSVVMTREKMDVLGPGNYSSRRASRSLRGRQWARKIKTTKDRHVASQTRDIPNEQQLLRPTGRN